LSHQDEDKPIYNIRMYSEQVKETRKKPDNILTWKKTDLCSYLRGVFDSRGLIYVNDSNKTVLSIQLSDMNKLELYQNILQKLNINSFLYYPQKENELGELFIVGEINIERFQNQIGFIYPKEIDLFYNYHKTMDWED
jgi:intein-encoded DNA endonuclease-like protein